MYQIIACSAFAAVFSVVSHILKNQIRRYQGVILLIQTLGLLVGFAAYCCLILTT